MQSNNFTVILLAAGQGKRMQQKIPKAYIKCNNQPLINYSIKFFAKIKKVENIIIVIDPLHKKYFCDLKVEEFIEKPFEIVLGGKTRQESVYKALEYSKKKKPDIVCIHDSARPIIRKKTIDDIITKLEKNHAVAPAIKIYDTLVSLSEAKNPNYLQNRDIYRKIQTPQFFHYQKIFKAHCDARKKNAKLYNDDISIAKDYGLNIDFSQGQCDNIKVTDEETLDMVEAILSSKHYTVTALGYDCHSVKKAKDKNNAIMIANIPIPCDLQVIAHSDGDVVLHALCDALYGSLGCGDIGTFFPPNQMKWKNADSSIFLKHALNMLKQQNIRLIHTDITIIAQKPLISPFSDRIKQKLALLLGIKMRQISVKAKTNENIGFIGRGEGIAALVVVTVSLPDNSI